MALQFPHESEPPGGLIKPQIPGHTPRLRFSRAGCGPRICPSGKFQVMRMLLAQEPHFENVCLADPSAKQFSKVFVPVHRPASSGWESKGAVWHQPPSRTLSHGPSWEVSIKVSCSFIKREMFTFKRFFFFFFERDGGREGKMGVGREKHPFVLPLIYMFIGCCLHVP